MKICLAASAGGHLTQLLKIRPACQNHDYFIVATGDRPVDLEGEGDRFYCVPWANRNHPILMAKMLSHCIRLLMKERPDVLISTGAAVGCVIAVLMKIAGRKVIWIDTISHTEYLTLSGKIVRRFADLFLVQWPELSQEYKGAKYEGSVI